MRVIALLVLACLGCAIHGRRFQGVPGTQSAPVRQVGLPSSSNALAQLLLASQPLSAWQPAAIGHQGKVGLRRGAPRMSLETEEGKAWHALGFNVGMQLGDLQGLEEEAVDDVLSGIKRACMGLEPEADVQEYVPKAAKMLEEMAAQENEAAVAEGVKYLEEAAKEEGATTTDSGLVMVTLEEGDGPSPSASDEVEVHYEGTLIDGTVFDSSYKRGKTISFPLAGVIKGWTEGLQLMKVGGKAKLTIPYELAYGAPGSPPAIPPLATLVFTVELISIK